jgi:MFS family permease
LFVLAHFSHHLMMALFTPLQTFIREDFSLTYTEIGWLVMAFNLSYGVTQLPGGWAADRLGPRIVLTLGVAGVATVGLLIGLSPFYATLPILLVLLGVIGGGYHPAAAPLVSAAVTPDKRGRALGLHQIGGTASFFLAPLIAAALAGGLGWRGTYIAIAIPTIIFGIIFFFLLGRIKPAGTAQTVSPVGGPEISSTPGHTRRLAVFVFLGVTSMVSIYSTMSFLPLFIVDSFEGVSYETAAAMVSFIHLGGLWAGPLGGYLSDRLGKVPVLLVASLIAGPALYLLTLAPFGAGLITVLIILGSAEYLGMPVVESYIISHVSARRRSTVLGIYYLGSRGGPAIAPLIGYFADNYGFPTTFTWVGAAMVVITIVCGVLLWGKKD